MNTKIIMIATLVSLSNICFCQRANTPDNIVSSEEIIRRIITVGMVEGEMEKSINRMGDAAAVLVTKVVAEKQLSVRESDSILEILNLAFIDPSFIEIAPDREPRTTLLVLNYLDCSTKDEELKKRISITRIRIQERYLKFTQTSPQR